jgi:oxygen-independent coproporphyrinogen-3 oxidase
VAGLYLHIPFCEHKCVYCDFYSIESLDPVTPFLSALRGEIALYAPYAAQESFGTLFFGGGTPSLLTPEQIASILMQLSRTFRIEEGAERTLEANPGTVDEGTLRGYREAGINRISFGVQSFRDEELRFLTRIHTADEAVKGLEAARSAGFTNVNLDLIFALPGQGLREWQDNLRRAIELAPEHISAYSLIVETNTPLARMVASRQVSPLPTELEAEMYRVTMEMLEEAGYEHYEVSNYAKPGFYSRHNMNYWNHTPYLGFGPSAHSYWSGRRWWNVANVQNYASLIAAGRTPVVGEETLTSGQLFDEQIMLGLRSGGVDLRRLAGEPGSEPLGREHPALRALIEERLAVLEDARLRLTRNGFLLCDEITRRLLTMMTPA